MHRAPTHPDSALDASRRILVGFLAACVALAGWIGPSPLLHRWLEHGGSGPAHTHLSPGRPGHMGLGVQSHTRFHSHPHTHVHADVPVTAEPHTPHPMRGILARGGSTFPTPAELLAGIGRMLGILPGAATDESPAGDPDSGHQHHSLSTLLVQGLVDQAAGFLPLIFPPPPVAWRPCLAEPDHRVPAHGRRLSDRGPPPAPSRS